MYALRKKYGLLAGEVNAAAVEDWLAKTSKLVASGWPAELAGRISAQQVFRTFGEERGVDAISVMEIFESATEHGVQPLRVGQRVLGAVDGDRELDGEPRATRRGVRCRPRTSLPR